MKESNVKTVVGLFDDMEQAKRAALDLEGAGIPHNDISIVANNEGGRYVPSDGTTTADRDATPDVSGHAIGHDALVGAEIGGVAGLILGLTGLAIPGLGWIAGAGWLMALILGAGTGAVVGGLVGALTHVGVPEEDAAHYNEGVRRGGTLIAVKAQDAMAHRVAEILGNDGAVNIDERAEQYRQEGFMPTPNTPATATTTTSTAARSTTNVNTAAGATPTQRPANLQGTARREGEQVLPVTEEELQVGKREVQRGGVRVYTHVTEQPVQEQVQLREEHVTVERHPVDRPINPKDMAAFKEGSIEVRETAEEPVISKQARVVEEVVVGKQATERTQTVQDTVRRTDVEVEQLQGSEHTSRTRSYDAFANDFRSNYQTNYASQGGSYEQYDPAYRYGYELNNNAAYRGRDWASIEPDIRRDWETRYPNSWDRFKNSIRYAWDKGTGAERGGIQTGGRDIDGTPDTRGLAEKAADAVTGDRIDDKTGKPVD
jgi:uncharacterized protein (TIGR02271 family)